MIIIGSKGFAKEVLEVMHQLNKTNNLFFYDDITNNLPEHLFGKFGLIKSLEHAKLHFSKVDSRYTIGIGNPALRRKMYNKFSDIGGILESTVSPKATIGNFGNKIGEGCNVMTGVIITADVKLGKCVLVNINSTIGHDTIIDDFAEICPAVNISGNCRIGKGAFIGTNATILPGVEIGNNCIIGAGSVVTQSIPDNKKAVGVPAKIIGTMI